MKRKSMFDAMDLRAKKWCRRNKVSYVFLASLCVQGLCAVFFLFGVIFAVLWYRLL